jgi:hypothetical protein
MHLAARQTLPHKPDFLARRASGEVLILSSEPLKAVFLDTYDPMLGPLSHTAVRPDAIGLEVDEHRVWVLDRFGVTEYDAGTARERLPLPVPSDMRAGGCIRVDGGFVVALEHDERSQTHPVVLRIADGGQTLWMTTLPMEDLAFGRSRTGDSRFGLRTWVCSYFTAGILRVSEDALFVVFKDMPGSGMGQGYVLDLGTGAFRFATRLGPIQNVAPIGAGEFLVGYQGYGQFETLHYGRTGLVRDTWASQGRYVVADRDCRVLETRNDSSMTHVVRLAPGGQVIGGAQLHDYASVPCVDRAGRIIFFQAGMLCAVTDLVMDDRLHVFDDFEDRFTTPVVLGDGCVYVAVTQNIWVRNGSDRQLKTRSELLRVDV